MSFGGAGLGAKDTPREATGRQVNRALGTGPPDPNQIEIESGEGFFGTVANALSTAAGIVGTIVGGPVGIGLRAASALHGGISLGRQALGKPDAKKPQKTAAAKAAEAVAATRASLIENEKERLGKKKLGASQKLGNN